MFVLKKLVTPFLLPPGVFVLAALAAAAVFALRRRLRAAVLALLAGVLLWLPATSPVSDLLLQGLTAGLPGPDAPLDGDVIVVLGGGIDDEIEDPFGAPGVPGVRMTSRLVTGARLHRRLGLPVIVAGGAPQNTRVTEAAVAARYLAELGVPRGEIIAEDRSRDTMENARNVAAVCRARQYSKIILVTSTHHLKRSVAAFGGMGLAIRPVGDAAPPPAFRSYRWNDFLPSTYESTSQYLHEYLGLAAYRLARLLPG